MPSTPDRPWPEEHFISGSPPQTHNSYHEKDIKQTQWRTSWHLNITPSKTRATWGNVTAQGGAKRDVVHMPREETVTTRRGCEVHKTVNLKLLKNKEVPKKRHTLYLTASLVNSNKCLKNWQQSLKLFQKKWRGGKLPNSSMRQNPDTKAGWKLQTNIPTNMGATS